MTATITSTSLINKPGIGFVPFHKDTDTVESKEQAQKLLEASKELWEKQSNCTVVEYVEGQTFTIQTSETQQLKFEVSE